MYNNTNALLCQIKDKLTEVDALINTLLEHDKVAKLISTYTSCSANGKLSRRQFYRVYGCSLAEAINGLDSSDTAKLKAMVEPGSSLYRLALKRQKYLKESPWEV